MNQKVTLAIGAISGAIAVMLGAFGAHAFKPYLAETGRLETFELAVRYLFYHTFAILIAGVVQGWFNSRLVRAAPVAFLSGIVLFSGSLLALCFSGPAWVVSITPFGGVLFITGWLLLSAGILKAK